MLALLSGQRYRWHQHGEMAASHGSSVSHVLSGVVQHRQSFGGKYGGQQLRLGHKTNLGLLGLSDLKLLRFPDNLNAYSVVAVPLHLRSSLIQRSLKPLASFFPCCDYFALNIPGTESFPCL